MPAGEKLRPGEETVSFHLLRKGARAEEKRRENDDPGNDYTVRSAFRGPFFWRVVARAKSKAESTRGMRVVGAHAAGLRVTGNGGGSATYSSTSGATNFRVESTVPEPDPPKPTVKRKPARKPAVNKKDPAKAPTPKAKPKPKATKKKPQ